MRSIVTPQAHNYKSEYNGLNRDSSVSGCNNPLKTQYAVTVKSIYLHYHDGFGIN